MRRRRTLHGTCKHRACSEQFRFCFWSAEFCLPMTSLTKKKINAVIGSLYNPQVRSDPNRMAALTTTDFDGDIDSIPTRTVWCETACESFRVRVMKFVTSDVVLVDSETVVGIVSMSKWLMILKRDATG